MVLVDDETFGRAAVELANTVGRSGDELTAAWAAEAAGRLAPLDEEIDWPPGVPPRRWTARGGAAADAVLAVVARSAIDLLTGPWSERVRRCEAPGCPRLFVARDARRRWCSSATCGNRVRVARHAARRRGDLTD